MKYFFTVLLLFFLLVGENCKKQKTENILARVGNSTLSEEEVNKHIDTTRGNVSQQIRDYVAYWVNNELVYQEAKTKGLEKSEEVMSQLEEVKRQLVNRTFLDQQQFYDSSKVNEQALQEYFNEHKNEFYTREDMIKLNIAVFDNRQSASTFAIAVSRSNDWDEVVRRFREDTTTSSGIISFKSGQYYTQHTIFPPELWKIVSATSLNDVSFPIKTSVGYFILQPIALYKEGTLPDFEFVKEEVRGRLIHVLKKRGYEELIDKLKKKYKVEVFLKENTP